MTRAIKNGDIKIGERVKNLREERHLTQKRLAESVMISSSSITRLESGSSMVSVFTLLKIADVLDIGIEDILWDYTRLRKMDVDGKSLNRRISQMPEDKRRAILKIMEDIIDIM